MKRIFTLASLSGVLLLAAPFALAAAPLRQTDEPGAAAYIPFVVIGIVLALLVGRQILMRPSTPTPLEPGRQRSYGVAGAAVCRNCGLPFARSPLDMNMLVGKLVRCPHCGKWAVLPAASPAEVAAAEERERLKSGGSPVAAPIVAQLSEEEKLRRRIEESKFE